MFQEAFFAQNHLLVWISIAVVFVAAYSFYSYATMCQPVANQSDVQWLKSIPIAHRGLHTNSFEIPENSMAAFERAIIERYAIEFDVQLSADNKIIIFHDDNLKRMTGVDKNIKDCTYEELLKFKLLNSEYSIPLFSEVLQLVNGRVPILIEIKNKGEVGGLEQAVYNEIKEYKGQLAVQSFNPYSLKWFRQNAPDILRGQLSGSFNNEELAWYKKIVLKNLMLNFESKPAFIAYEIGELPKVVVTNQYKKGAVVIGWTAKSSEEYTLALQHCDNVIFEGLNLVH